MVASDKYKWLLTYKDYKLAAFIAPVHRKVIDFLLNMKMDKKYLTNVITSGEAAMHAINQNKFGKTFFHLGPPRDSSIFNAACSKLNSSFS